MKEKANIILLEIAIIVFLTIIIGAITAGVLYSTNKSPNRIESFCRAQHEMYNKPLDECVAIYSNRTI